MVSVCPLFGAGETLKLAAVTGTFPVMSKIAMFGPAAFVPS